MTESQGKMSAIQECYREPWRFELEDLGWIVNHENRTVAKADADVGERIVACVNALAAFSDEELESLVITKPDIQQKISDSFQPRNGDSY